MADIAVSTIDWPNKIEAARILNVSVKTLEKYVAEGRLVQKMQAQINKPARAVIDPESLRRMVEERSRMVVRESPALSSRMEVREPPAKVEDVLPPSELARKLWLTESEASRYTGLGAGYIARRLAGERIGPRGARVYRRADLEAL